jgi:hypothetical protein
VPRNGTWPERGADHRAAQSATWAAARDDAERLAAAFAMFRSAAALLGRRRPSRGTPASAHRDTAARLVRETAAHLKSLAEAIDRGDYDTRGG